MIYHIGKNNLEITVRDERSGQILCNKDTCTKNTTDPVARKIYLAATNAFVFYQNRFQFFGIDGKGALPELIVHWSDPQKAPNASSHCIKPGDCELTFHDKHANNSTLVHEWTHSIIDSVTPGGLKYERESGALHESLADVMAVIYQISINITTWTVAGRDITIFPSAYKELPPNIKLTDQNDWGYVHDNSQIASHAFFLAATKGHQYTRISQFNTIAEIWFQTMLNLDSIENFASFANKTILQCEKDYYQHPSLIQLLKEAWKEVGVTPEPLPITYLPEIVQSESTSSIESLEDFDLSN